MTDYNKLKVVELKELLKERGIPSTGLTRKQQIVEALEAADADAAPDESGGVDAPEEQSEQDEGEGEAAMKEDVGVEPMSEPAQAEEEDKVEVDKKENEEDKAEVDKKEEDGEDKAEVDKKEDEDEVVVEAVSSPASESRKRKRRSVTPPVDAEVVQKKLKSASQDELPKLPEDFVVEDAPALVEEEAVAEEAEEVPPTASDDAIPPQEILATSDEPPPMPDARDGQPDEPMDTAPPLEADPSTPPSLHPPTRSLYIRDLLRPLQPAQLREHILSLASPSQNPSSDTITTFHLDAIRTHAFITFSTPSAALRVRKALHATTWPDESARKPLWVDFIPDDKVTEWIERETDGAGAGRRDTRRWEVEYTTNTETGSTHTQLNEVHAPPPTGPRRPSSGIPARADPIAPTGGAGEGMFHAPLGPRSNAPHHRAPPPPSSSQRAPAPEPSPTFATLDTRFPSTTTKPRLYYLPCPAPVVAARLEALTTVTSSTWDDRHMADDREPGLSARERQLRRYTFEKEERGRSGDGDGDAGWRVVDGGMDIGVFGRPQGGEGWRGGGRGGRGGWK